MSDQLQPTNTSPHVHFVPHPDGGVIAKPVFRWDVNQEQAAVDLAEGSRSMREIARRAGVNEMTLWNWRQHPEFKAKVEEHRKVFAGMVLTYGLTQKATRLQALQDQYDQIMAVVEARGRDLEDRYPEVPGGATGYVYPKNTAYGTEYLIDTKTAALLNDIRKQAAIEVGEWNEGTAPAVAVQIVCPSGAPDAAKIPTVTIGAK